MVSIIIVGFFWCSSFHFVFLLLLLTDDHSRVILGKEDGDSKSDYINASYIPVRIFLRLGCLNKQEDDCSENIAEKMTLRSFNLLSRLTKSRPICHM